jgi:LacI family transcriptional regulator
LKGIDQQLQSSGYLPIIMDAHNDRDRFERYVDMLIERRVEGLIIVANWLFMQVEALKTIPGNKLPTVVVGRDLHRAHIPSILVDNEVGGYKALKHIYDLGHRQIAFLIGPKKLADSDRRWEGMRQFAREAGLALDPARVLRMHSSADPLSGFDAGRDLTLELVHSGAKMTAIVAFDDLTALGVVRALSDCNIRVPNECSVIGFDDVPMAALASPGLTTVRQPMSQMGILASESILQSIQGPDTPNRRKLTLLEPTLVVRGSTRSLFKAE